MHRIHTSAVREKARLLVRCRPLLVVLTASSLGLTTLAPSAFADDGILILSGNDAVNYVKSSTVKVKPLSQKQKPQPKVIASNQNVNARLVRFCHSNLGRKVGNGQCTELAVLGLPASGGVVDFSNLWGRNVCQFDAVNGRPVVRLGPAGVLPHNKKKVDVRAGDIIQYENVRFLRTWEGGYSEKTYPHHTSVIASVSRDGQTYRVYEQNVNGTQYVLETSLYMPELVAGTMRISRPIPRP